MGNGFLHGNGGSKVLKVQKKSGTVQSNSSNNATVNCGFRPDIVFFTKNESSEGYNYSAAADFYSSGKSSICLAMWSTSNTYTIYDLIVSRTSTGFTFRAFGYTDDWEETNISTSFQYTAVKYTEDT